MAKQKAVLQLLVHIHQPAVVPEIKEVATTFNWEQNVNNFNDVKTVENLINLLKTGGILGRKNNFSPLYKTHLRQAKSVFEVLYNAKDWKTFFNVASYLRERVNYGLFVYAFSAAVLHRPDTQGVVLPPLYEVCPHFYVNEKTIQKAYEARMKVSSMGTGKESVVIPSNYTGWINLQNPELRTSYFTEDVGLNFYHFVHHLTYPQWLKQEYYGIKNERQGELFYFTHQQLLARYRLERHANFMYPMKNFSFGEPNVVAYAPKLRYFNGEAVPSRPENIKIRDYDLAEVERVKDYERRLRDAVDQGYVKTVKGEKIPLTTETGIDVLGRLVQKGITSVNPKYYGALYQLTLNLLGHVVDPYHQNNVAPSVLQHYETMLRDPMYYRLYQHVNRIFESYKKTLPVYTKETLQFPGVTVEKVEVDKLMTYFENFDVDVTNAVVVGKVEDDKLLKIVVRQPRLNHKDFTYRVTVNSNQDTTALVHVFLAPKYDVTGTRELGLAEKKQFMVQIDRFLYDLKNGKTVIERNSKDSTVSVPDFTSFRVLSKKVEDALQGKSQFYVNDVSF